MGLTSIQVECHHRRTGWLEDFPHNCTYTLLLFRQEPDSPAPHIKIGQARSVKALGSLVLVAYRGIGQHLSGP